MAAIDIAAKTRKLDVDQRLPLKYYYRSADNVLRQADVYRREDNKIELYVLLLRFASLITETIPEHKEYKMGEFRDERDDFKRRLLDILGELERLKPVVMAMNTCKKSTTAPRPSIQNGAWPSYDMGSQAESFFSDPFVKPPSVNSMTTFQTNSTFDLLSGSMDLLTGPPPVSKPEPVNFDSLANTFTTMNLNIPRAKSETLSRHSFFGSLNQQPIRTTQARVQYPTSFIDVGPISMPSLDPNWATKSTPTISDSQNPNSLPEPVLWPDSGVMEGPSPPIAHPVLDIAPEVKLIRQPSPPPMEVPVQSVQPLPSDVADPRPGPPTEVETLDETKGPKPLHISAKMMEEFMRLVKSNTLRNLETCGVLAGTLKKGTFYISTLVLPKQEATSDSCQTINEEEIFEAQDKRGLFQLGWIHTHPSQSCFMSSIDLHTHYSYQIMLQEAIAVVMAPSDTSRRYGIFRLSDPGGVKVIQKCNQRGFHPHETPPGGGPIYEHSSHVFLNPNLNFDVIDLR